MSPRRGSSCQKSFATELRIKRVKPVRILLVKLNHIGDTLLMTPTTGLLRQQFPNAVIDVVVRKGCEAILEGNSDISEVFAVGHLDQKHRSRITAMRETFGTLRRFALRRYDYAFDLSNSDRAKTIILLSAARIRAVNDRVFELGWKCKLFNRVSHFDWSNQHQVLRDFRTVTDVLDIAAEPGPLVLNVKEPAELAVKLPFFVSDGPFAAIHATTRWTFKQWLPERWATVADELQARHNLKIVFTCGPTSQEIAHVESIRALSKGRHSSTEGKLTLSEQAALLKRAKILLSVDTLAVHMGAAVQIPVVALYGKSRAEAWGPWQCPSVPIQGICHCRREKRMTCERGRPYDCMKSISVSQVLDAGERLLIH